MDQYRVVLAAISQQAEERSDEQRSDEEQSDEEQSEQTRGNDLATTSFVARIPQLGVEVHGSSRSEALENLEREMAAQLENMREQGVEPPAPIDETPVEGRIEVKVSPQLHRDLLFAAAEAGIDLETLAVELLARGVTGRPPRRAGSRPHEGGGRGRRRGRPDQQQYHNIMENRADFIQYIREQHEGPQGSGRGGRGGGRGRRR